MRERRRVVASEITFSTDWLIVLLRSVFVISVFFVVSLSATAENTKKKKHRVVNGGQGCRSLLLAVDTKRTTHTR